MKKVVHFRDQRMFVNAGTRFPLCCANATMLDMNKSRLETTADREKVSCKHCLKMLAVRPKP
jgi:hypothetical protein